MTDRLERARPWAVSRGIVAAGLIPALFATCEGEVPPPTNRTFTFERSIGIEPVRADLAWSEPPAAPLVDQAATRSPVRAAVARSAAELVGDLSAVTQHPTDVQLLEDSSAVQSVIAGESDFAITAAAPDPGPGSALQASALGAELFALAVPEESPLHGLPVPNARRLLTGAALDWRELGLEPGPILVAVPADPAVRRRAERALLAGGRFRVDSVPADDREALDLLRREDRAIAVVHVSVLSAERGVRALDLDGVQATVRAFTAGDYQAGVPLFLVTSGPPRGPAAELLAAVRAGRACLGAGLCPPQ